MNRAAFLTPSAAIRRVETIAGAGEILLCRWAVTGAASGYIQATAKHETADTIAVARLWPIPTRTRRLERAGPNGNCRVRTPYGGPTGRQALASVMR